MDQTGENCKMKVLIQRLESMECQLSVLTQHQCFFETQQECMIRFMDDLQESMIRFMNDLAGKAGNSQRVSNIPVARWPASRLPARSHSARMKQSNFLKRPPAAAHDKGVVASLLVAAVIPPEDAAGTSAHPHAHHGNDVAASPLLPIPVPHNDEAPTEHPQKPPHSHKAPTHENTAQMAREQSSHNYNFLNSNSGYQRIGDGAENFQAARMCSIYDP